MNILFIGDIIGRPGRSAIKQVLPELRKEYEIDFVIANGENLASGIGMTEKTYQEMIDAGIDYFTSGNHIFDKQEFLPILDHKSTKVLRPANYPESTEGKGWVDLKIAGKIVRLINLQGRVFMKDLIDNPFYVVDELINLKSNVYCLKPEIILIDFHAEATSEKNSLAHYLDGRVAAVIGTHTHIQTNDARVLSKETAFITDLGMVGPVNSSLGADLENAYDTFLNGTPFKMEPAKGPKIFNSVLLKINPKNKVEIIEIINRNIE